MSFIIKFISFYIFSIILSAYDSYVLINLKKNIKENIINNEYSPETLIDNLFNKYYGILNVGYPPQKTEVQFSLDYFGLSMKENICITSNYYNKGNSLTISQTHAYDLDRYSKETIVANESIEFIVYNSSTDKSFYISIPDYIFIYNKDTNETKGEQNLDKDVPAKACLIYGFKFSCPIGQFICNEITSYLRRNGLTISDNFHYIYYTNEEKKKNGGYDAAILIGENPHEYNKKKFNENNYMTAKALSIANELGWIIGFKNYYYLSNGTKIEFGITPSLNFRVKGWLLLDLDIIIGIKEYLNSIKDNYFNHYEKECKSGIFRDNYTVFWCDKDFDTKNFPTLYLQSTDFNYTFELTHKELFEIRGDKKYFLIVFDSQSKISWKFGKLFLQKYFFNFETDSKQIGFYNNLNPTSPNDEQNEPETKIWIWILWSGIVIVVGVVGFVIGFNIRKKIRKKRANELDDEDFEYKQKNKNNEKEEPFNEDNNNNKNSLGIN